MNSTEYIETEDRYQIPTYRKLPLVADRGRGCYLWNPEGDRYLDFYGGHCVTILGHCHRSVTEAISDQSERLTFYSNYVYSTIRATAANQLASLAPAGLQNVFFCNSGTEANETALKLGRLTSGRSGVLAMEGSFHGRTLGSLAATWTPAYREPHKAVLAEVHFAEFGNLASAEATLDARPEIGVIILEPIQSMAGIRIAEPSYYVALRDLATRRGLTLIFDEVQTGVGRTGTFSISEQFGMTPDLITLAKSLGNGIPVGAVLVSDAIAADVHPGDQGTTFGGGMIAAAAISAVLETIVEHDLMKNAVRIFNHLKNELSQLPCEVSGLGCLIGVRFPQPVKPLISALFERNVLVGSSGDPHVIRLMPPINTPISAIEEFVSKCTSAWKSLGHEKQV